jgi:3-oxoacyl-[acyl-carrier protein] reductase
MSVILVTGANGGLGQAIARSFLEESTDNFLWLAVHHRSEHAGKLADQFTGRAATLELDVANPLSWQAALKVILQQQERIDVLVNNAGKHQDGLLATMEPKAWDDVLSINLDSVFHGSRAVLPSMISQRHGRIINISSLSALLAPAGQTNYAASKAGVIALTQSLAKEVARIGITVNAICPGYIETEGLGAWSADERAAAVARVPMRRLGRPEEVAAAVRFLACREASYITGSVLKVDGGIF